MAKWTQKEVEYLKENYDGSKNICKRLSKQINHTPNAIRNKAYRLGITNNNEWAKEEIEKLVKRYNENNKRGDINLKDLAKEIGRSKSNICRKARELGLTNQNRKLNENFKEYLSKNTKNWWENLSEDKQKELKNVIVWYAKNDHPKGMQGKKHDKETRKNMSKRLKARWEDPNSYLNSEEHKQLQSNSQSKRMKNKFKNNKSIYSNSKQGKRKDLNNTYFRSAWEANYARFLDYINVEWEYEPKTFMFEQIKRGTRSYTPDFYLPEEDRWIEVKGWFRSKDKTKLKRFKKYYPEEFKKLTLVIKKPYTGKQAEVANKIGIKNIEGYKEIKDKFAGLIKNWE